jgi:uncharacterized protein involved in exopolysaccharide biosynthesis
LSPPDRRELQEQVAALQARLADLHARLPAHSIPPAMMAELDEIEQQLQQAETLLEQLTSS